MSGIENMLELPARFVYYILVKLEALRFFVKTLKTKTLRANSEGKNDTIASFKAPPNLLKTIAGDGPR